MVTFVAIGSRGDVEPQAILAGALVARGKAATVVAADEYGPLVAEYGARFRGIGSALDSINEIGRGWRGQGALRVAAMQPSFLRRWLAGLAGPLAEVLIDAVPQDSLVVTGVASRDAALALVEARGCRMITVVHSAILPTAHPDSHLEGPWFFNWSLRDRAFAKWYWRATSGISTSSSTVLRDRLGLGKPNSRISTADADRQPILMAADAALVPTASDWPEFCRPTGSIWQPSAGSWVPEPGLVTFLADGRAPVYIGLGSFNDSGGQHWQELIIAASQRSGRRVLTPALPGQQPGLLTPGVYAISSLPHSWLFPKMAAVLHHGGAGTTASALRAGVPQAAVPAMFDQHYHARRLTVLGVGPGVAPLHRLSVSLLSATITALADPRYQERARVVAEEIGATDGLSQALDEILAYA